MPDSTLRIAIGQMDCVVGDVAANMDTIERMAREAAAEGAELIVFPELALSGYAVGKNFDQASISHRGEEVKRLKKLSREIGLVVGFIEETEDMEFFNSAMFIHGGRIHHVHRKIYLPNYRIFDERRYFGAGAGVWAFDTPWRRMAILICGDAWHLPLPYFAVKDGADILIVVAASSREGLTPALSVRDVWERMNQSYALMMSSFVVFANRVGSESANGGDPDLRLDFWGGSHVCHPSGEMSSQAPIGEESVHICDLDLTQLRRQRLILPFRRDDSLAFTLNVGRRILRSKAERRDGFMSLVGLAADEAGDVIEGSGPSS